MNLKKENKKEGKEKEKKEKMGYVYNPCALTRLQPEVIWSC